MFIRDTDSIKDNKIHEGDPDKTEHYLNWVICASITVSITYDYVRILHTGEEDW